MKSRFAPGSLCCLLMLIMVAVGFKPHSTAAQVLQNIPVGKAPTGVAVDTMRNLVYVANSGDGTLSVIDGATNKMIKTLFVGGSLGAVIVNPNSGAVLAADEASNAVVVIKSALLQLIGRIPVGRGPHHLALDINSGDVYVTNRVDGTLSVIHNLQVTRTLSVGPQPGGVGVSYVAGDAHAPENVFVAVASSGTGAMGKLLALNPASLKVVGSVMLGGTVPGGLAVNWRNYVGDTPNFRVYVANTVSGTLSTVTTNLTSLVTTFPVTPHPQEVAVDIYSNEYFVTDATNQTVSVVLGDNNVTSRVYSFAAMPTGVAANYQSARFYVAHSDGMLSVIQEPPSRFVISGRVTDEAGRGLARIPVHITGSRTVVTDAQGYYHSPTLRPVYPYSLAPDLSATPNSPRLAPLPNFERVVLTTHDVTGVNFLAVSSEEARGRVLTPDGEAIPGATVTQQGPNGSTRSTLTDRQGDYHFPNTPRGTYTYIVQKSGYGFGPPRQTKLLDVREIPSFIGVPAPFIIGQVNRGLAGGRDLSPFAGVLVEAQHGQRLTTTVTDTNGYYFFSNLPPGNYTVTAKHPDYAFTPSVTPVTLTATNGAFKNFNAAPVKLPLSPVKLSGEMATANSTQVTLRFSGPLASDLAATPTYYQVLVDNQQVTVNSASYDEATHVVTLALSGYPIFNSQLSSGQQVEVSYNLLDAEGRVALGESGPFLAK